MTARQSEQLSSLLKASFKELFDGQHHNHSSSIENYTNLHLQSILANPLFDAKPQSPALALRKTLHIEKCQVQPQDNWKLPVDVFKKQVSQGTADLETAKLCLKKQYNICLNTPSAVPRDLMRSSGAALVILQWLWSSGMEARGTFLWSSGIEAKGTFLHDLDFLALLIPFLVAEGHHARILRWLSRCRTTGEMPSCAPDMALIQRCLFTMLIKNEQRFGGGLESAINVLNQAVAGLIAQKWNRRSISHCSLKAVRSLKDTMLLKPEAVSLETSVIQGFVETTKYLLDRQSTAELCVFILKPPDPNPALTYFKNLSSELTPTIQPGQRSYVVHLGLRAADLFLERGHRMETLWIMDFLQENFAHELGLPLPHPRKTSMDRDKESLESENENLRLLEALAAL